VGRSEIEPGDEALQAAKNPPRRAAIPAVIRVLWWGLVIADAVMLAAAIGAVRLLGPRLLVGLPGPLCLGLVLGLIAWWHTRGPGAGTDRLKGLPAANPRGSPR
jgi:hypothetical protein